MNRYSEEFRANAVELYRDGGISVKRTAEKLGVADQTLRNWIARYDDIDAYQKAVSNEEIRRLRRDNARLEEEVAVLKKAAVYLGQANVTRN